MKDLRGQATGTVSADPERCFDVLLAVDRYPAAYPEVIRHVEVVKRGRNGSPLIARATVHLTIGPLQRDVELLMKMSSEPNRIVRLTRIPDDRSDHERLSLTWQITPGPPTRLTVRLRARLDVPRMIPTNGAGGSLARGLLEAALRTVENQSGYAAATARGSSAMASARSS
ncbi:MAG TPA: SRPBCC family protein [Solirubrobacteraceae bacterium]